MSRLAILAFVAAAGLLAMPVAAAEPQVPAPTELLGACVAGVSGWCSGLACAWFSLQVPFCVRITLP